jgi:hypothetical protein
MKNPFLSTVLITLLVASHSLFAEIAWVPTAALFGATSVSTSYVLSSGKKFTVNDTKDKNKLLAVFVNENAATLAYDIACGNGQTLDAVSEIIDIKTDNRKEFYLALKNNYDLIFQYRDTQHIADGINQVSKKYL